jgi:hypothetical protein
MNQIIIGRDRIIGKPVLSLKDGESDKYPFEFGVVMAKRLLQAFKQEPDFLEKFVRESECTA